jgi:hypothetical protein
MNPLQRLIIILDYGHLYILDGICLYSLSDSLQNSISGPYDERGGEENSSRCGLHLLHCGVHENTHVE